MNMGRSFSKFTSWCGLILFISIVTLQCFDITEVSDTVRDDLIAKRGDTARSVNSTTTQSTHAELSKYILVYIKGSTSIAFLFFSLQIFHHISSFSYDFVLLITLSHKHTSNTVWLSFSMLIVILFLCLYML